MLNSTPSPMALGLSPSDFAFIGGDALLGSIADALTPPERLDPVAWGEKYRILTSKEASEPGPWRVSRTPYLREIFYALSQESPYQIVVVQKGAQLAFTDCGLIWLGWGFDQDPVTSMVVWPTEGMITKNVKQKVDPFFAGCEPLLKLFGGKKDRAGGNTLKQKSSPVAEAIFTSAGSATGLRSTSAGRIMLDEVDGYEDDIDDEGDPISLAMERTNTFGYRRKIFIPSTPTIEGQSRVSAWYRRSDQRRYHVPCPHCGAMQVLQFERLSWTVGKPETARYACEACEEPIAESHKTWMLENGEWRGSAESQSPTLVGYQISGLYSPLGWSSWGDLLGKWELARGDEGAMKAFVNTTLGETWKLAGEAPAASSVERLKEHFEDGALHERALLVTAGIDQQRDRLEAYVWAWGDKLERWLIDSFVIDRFRSEAVDGVERRVPLTEVQLAAVVSKELTARQYSHPSGAVLRVERACYDTGDDTMFAYGVVRNCTAASSDGKRVVIAVKGEEGEGADRAVRGPFYVDDKSEKKLPRWRIATSFLKSELYRHIGNAKPEKDGEEPWAGYVHLSDTLSDEQIAQLVSERRERSKRGKWGWKKLRDRNEALDCAVMARAAMALLKADMWTSVAWKKRLKAVQKAGAEAESAPPAHEDHKSQDHKSQSTAAPVARPRRRVWGRM